MNETRLASRECENKSNLLFYGLRKKDKFFYSIGHVLNDMCSSVWFTYLLLYFNMVLQMNDIYSGLLLLLGQLIDGIATLYVGFQSNRDCCTSLFQKYGKLKTWHLLGTICVAFSFPAVFTRLPGHTESPNNILTFMYYAVFIMVFQVGWAASSVSHLSLIPNLTDCSEERTELNAYRYAWTVTGNMCVYVVTWLVLKKSSVNSANAIGPDDDYKFRNLVLIVVGTGLIFSILFHVFVKESKIEVCTQNRRDEQAADSFEPNASKTWKCWLKQVSFYQVCTKL
ncbi:MFSD12 (predicted) [Pycnogonum litorale]